MMADIRELEQYAAIRELDTHGEGNPQSNPYFGIYKRSAFAHGQPEPQKRTPRQIKDTASVMGIPSDEITPKVHEAMTLIMHEMDSIRWQAEVSKKHEAHLIEALDSHELLPVVSRHAFDQYLSHAAEHVARTKEPSFLLFIKILKLDELWLRNGAGLRDAFLIHAAGVIRSCLDEVDVVGALDHGEFGVILNLYQEEAVKTKVAAIDELMSKTPFVMAEEEYPITAVWGIQEIVAPGQPDHLVLAASEKARSSQAG
ncbi:MAG: GGDEF domain-containing protein [Rhodospirillaceae bacterium]|jgi:GGDEF domain-containing protein|nr:GGDEF domain-containing protein [Rhodospirillaceae bacterium]